MFFNNLNKICKEKNTSPSAVALNIGMSKSNVTKWKAGQTPKIETLLSIADYLQVELWDLIDKGPQNVKKPVPTEGYELSENDIKFIQILPKLTEQQKQMVLAQIKGLLSMQE